MNTNNSSIIVHAHENIAGTIGNLKEYVFSKERTIDVAEFVMGTLIGAGFLAMQFLPINGVHCGNVDTLWLSPVFGLLLMMVCSSIQNDHEGAACGFFLLIMLVMFLIGIAVFEISASYTQVGEPEQVSTADAYHQDGDTVYMYSADVIDDDGVVKNLWSYMYDTGAAGNVDMQDAFTIVQDCVNIDVPYVTANKVMIAPDADKMGFFGKLLHQMFPYRDSSKMTYTLYLPEGMYAEYAES